MPRLRLDFFNRSTLKVAEELLGKILVRKIPPRSNSGRGSPKSNLGGGRVILGMITEVEAYAGSKDEASHASRLWRGSPRAARGRTERNKIMFGKPGYWYVYMIYGMYHCLNIVTEKKGYPAAILIRSLDNIKGPGRLCGKFRIDRSFNGKPANKKTGLWIEDRNINPQKIKRAKRIGVDYAGKWKDKLRRFYF